MAEGGPIRKSRKLQTALLMASQAAYFAATLIAGRRGELGTLGYVAAMSAAPALLFAGPGIWPVFAAVGGIAAAYTWPSITSAAYAAATVMAAAWAMATPGGARNTAAEGSVSPPAAAEFSPAARGGAHVAAVTRTYVLDDGVAEAPKMELIAPPWVMAFRGEERLPIANSGELVRERLIMMSTRPFTARVRVGGAEVEVESRYVGATDLPKSLESQPLEGNIRTGITVEVGTEVTDDGGGGVEA